VVTTFRPDPNYPQMLAGVAWIDTSRASLALYPGRYEPPNDGSQPAEVPPALRQGLLATFNAGFKVEDSGGGFVDAGHVYAPLVDGQATLIAYRSGTVDVRSWTGGPVPGPNVLFARQNLPLLVSGGRVGGDPRQRGARVALGGRSRRPRRPAVRGSGSADRRQHRADPPARRRRPRDGARHQLRMGDVQLLRRLGGGEPQKPLPDMTRDATRYLTPDDRDFFAVYARR
jgi:hypothetical protein